MVITRGWDRNQAIETKRISLELKVDDVAKTFQVSRMGLQTQTASFWPARIGFLNIP